MEMITYTIYQLTGIPEYIQGIILLTFVLLIVFVAIKYSKNNKIDLNEKTDEELFKEEQIERIKNKKLNFKDEK